MNYTQLRSFIRDNSKLSFADATDELQTVLFEINKQELLSLIIEIGIIPEDIIHDSTEEKLYTKASDILFAKALKEMNFEVTVLKERSNCADIIAQSKHHGYSLVGDAKAFRLSRTAKNVKDFKVDSMVHWREDNDFSVLVCPYFQYPRTSSQIYRSALQGNVCLFSWEYLYIMLSENLRENDKVNFKELWNQSNGIMQQTNMADANKSFIPRQDTSIGQILGLTKKKCDCYFESIKSTILRRGNEEMRYYENEIDRIKRLSREDAVKELLESMKLDSKIETIRKFVNRIER